MYRIKLLVWLTGGCPNILKTIVFKAVKMCLCPLSFVSTTPVSIKAYKK